MNFHYHNPRFEYEDTFENVETAWSGHRYFAYDLDSNLKPGLIVELGSYKGTSFFAFFQSCVLTFFLKIDKLRNTLKIIEKKNE